MSKRVINDPASLGWVYDPSIDRWRWEPEDCSGDGGSSSGDIDDLERRVKQLETSIDGGSA